jgi:hypothetical protein
MAVNADKDWRETKAAMVDVGIMTARELAETIPDFHKPAGARCPHQRHHKGCMVYPRRPLGCRLWSCRWLTGDGTADLRRPDHSHYVIDIAPDYVRVDPTGGNNPDTTVPVVQVWLDPDYPDAHHDPALRAFLYRQAENGMAALIRLSNKKAFALFAPPMGGGEWFEKHGNTSEPEHSVLDKLANIGPMKITLVPGKPHG